MKYDAILIVVSNPPTFAGNTSRRTSQGFPKERVFGQAGILDTARLQGPLSPGRPGHPVKDVGTVVLGGHGDQMVSVISATTIGGVRCASSSRRRRSPRWSSCTAATAKGGGEARTADGHVRLVCAGQCCRADDSSILLDEKRVLPSTAYLEGDVASWVSYMGVPVKLGSKGIEQILRVEQGESEQGTLQASCRCRSRRRLGRDDPNRQTGRWAPASDVSFTGS